MLLWELQKVSFTVAWQAFVMQVAKIRGMMMTKYNIVYEKICLFLPNLPSSC